MKVKARYNHWLPKALKVYGITLFPWVLYSESKKEVRESSLFGHELIHVRQIRAVGWLYFYWTYWWDYLRDRLKGMSPDDAYMHNYYEAEAYAGELSVEASPEEIAEFGLDSD